LILDPISKDIDLIFCMKNYTYMNVYLTLFEETAAFDSGVSSFETNFMKRE